jgi:hypothetical protein
MNDFCSWCHQTDDFSYPSLAPAMKSPKYFTCPTCNRKIALIDIRNACEVVSKSRKTIYQWVSTGLISTVRGANGRLYICYSSLFLPPEQKDAGWLLEHEL